jgi:hypothetical protein
MRKVTVKELKKILDVKTGVCNVSCSGLSISLDGLLAIDRQLKAIPYPTTRNTLYSARSRLSFLSVPYSTIVSMLRFLLYIASKILMAAFNEYILNTSIK